MLIKGASKSTINFEMVHKSWHLRATDVYYVGKSLENMVVIVAVSKCITLNS